MADNIVTAYNLATWAPALGIDLPKELSDILATLDEAKYADYALPVVDARKLNPKNVQQFIQNRAVEYATADQFLKAKAEIQQRIAHAAITVAGEVAPKVRDEILPKFQHQVDHFVDAVNILGDDLDPGVLVRSGADRVQAFNTAVDSAGNILAVQNWLTTLTNVFRYAAFGVVPEPLRITKPTTRGQYQEIINAESPTQEIPGHLWYAAKNNVQIYPNLPDESKALQESLDAMDIENQPKLVSFR